MEKQTVAGAYAKISEHELDCERRYAQLQTSVALLTEQSQSIKTGVRVAIAGIVSIAIGLIGWLGVQVYELNREAVRTVRPEPASAVRAWPNVAAPVATKLGESQRFQGRNPA